jgi:hypothetical protein
MGLIMVLLCLFLAFLLFDNIAQRSLWPKSRLLFTFGAFRTFSACTSPKTFLAGLLMKGKAGMAFKEK